MKTELWAIGNSRGSESPTHHRAIGFGKSVELRVERTAWSFLPQRTPRQGLGRSFPGCRPSADDELLLENAGPNGVDCKEWKW